jgi:hypothetical protein
MTKRIEIDARNDPDLSRRVFSAAVGATPLPSDLSDKRSGQEIVHGIAKQAGVSKAEGERLVTKVMQREILTEGVNQKMAKSFVDPLEIPGRPETDTTPKQFLQGHSTVPRFVTQKKLPEWDEFQEKVFKFSGYEDRAEFAAQKIKDARGGKPPIDPAVMAEIQSNDGRQGVRDFLNWAEDGESKDTVLQSATTSSLHKLQTAYEAKAVLTLDRSSDEAQMVKLLPAYDHFFKVDPQVFLVQHDWAKAFDKAEGLDGEVPLPFEMCAFEFQISGRRLIVMCLANYAAIFVELTGSHYWYAGRIDTLDDMATRVTDEPGTFSMLGIHLARNIRSICIALDAEVAVTEVIRAPHRLNHQREKQGKKPVLDHHVVNLARRSRVEPLPSAGDREARWHPRLHFRRGHWRHFEDHKTWVRWCLVGDPDLGFIDKEYRA